MTDDQHAELIERQKIMEALQSEMSDRLLRLEITQENSIHQNEEFRSGVYRGLWIIGGGFLVALGNWIAKGGLF